MNRLQPARKRFRGPRYPLNAERLYQRLLRQLVVLLHAEADRELIREVEQLLREVKLFRPDAMDSPTIGYAERLRRMFVRVQGRLSHPIKVVQAQLDNLAEQIAERGRRDWRFLLEYSYGRDLSKPEPWWPQERAAWVARNQLHVEQLADATIARMHDHLFNELRGDPSGPGLHAALRLAAAPGLKRADFIARDQTAKLHGQLAQLRQEDFGVKLYRWRTMQDERVRSTHEANHGKIFRWDQPPGTGHPGDEPNCRCWAEPVLPALTVGAA